MPSDLITLHEYGISDRQAERAYKAVAADVKAAKDSGRTKLFAEKHLITAYDVMTHDQVKSWLRSF